MPIMITSRFKPLTYDEITKPLIQQTQAQEALEGAYMEASDKAALAMAQANQQTDRESYEKLRRYSEELQAQADALMRQGLNRNSRQSILNMRRRYNNDIIPIQLAADRRAKLVEEQRQLRLKNPDMLFERDANTISLDDLVRNPQFDYGTTISGEDIMKRAAALTSAVGKGRYDISYGRNLDPYTKQVLIQAGLTQEEIQAALAGDDSPLNKALEALYLSTGVDKWGNNPAAQNAVRGYIREGAIQGVGDFKATLQSDAEQARRDQLADREHSEAFQAKLYGMYKDSDGNWVYDPAHPGPKAKGKLKADGSADGVTDEDFEFVPKNVTGSNDYYRKKDDGTWWHKNGSKYYPVEPSTAAVLSENYVPLTQRTESRLRLIEEPLYFGGDDFGVIREDKSSFDEKDATKVDILSISKAARTKLINILKEHYPGVKLSDVTIYKDSDSLSRNEYKVVIE